MEAEDFVVRPAVIHAPGTIGGAIDWRLVVVDEAVHAAGNVVVGAGHAVALIGLGPAIESPQLAGRAIDAETRSTSWIGIFRLREGKDRLEIPRVVLGNGDGIAQAIGNLCAPGATNRQCTVAARIDFVPQPGVRLDVRINGWHVIAPA